MPADQLTNATSRDPCLPAPETTAQAAVEWQQLYIEFADWSTAEHAAVRHIAPLLEQAQADGTITAWWFIRKHPCWRLRLRPVPGDHAVTTRLRPALDQLAAQGHISRWWPGIYEAETAAFGGEQGMAVAHELFSADSYAIMGMLSGAETGLGRRELSVLLCHVMMRAAGLEWYEKGDAWHQVARERPLPADVPASRLTSMADNLKTLMLTDTGPDGALLGPHGPTAAAAGWAEAFRRAGDYLGERSRAGLLERGLRQVLSYHIIFHWNRLGLPYRTQSILAWAARTAILGPPPDTMTRHARTALREPASQAPSRSAPSPAPDRAIGRFPLIRQPRPRCAGLATRVQQVHELAASCHEPADAEARIDWACTAWNLAALIASDCAVPALAGELCEEQFRLFHAHWPLAGRTAIAALQPLVNLARLDIRAGNPEDAYQALDQICHAVEHGGSAQIRGTTLSFNGFTRDAAARSEVLPWLRNVVLQDGTRALASAGRWEQAAENAARHDPRPGHLRESRQAQVIMLAHSDQPGTALALLSSSVITEPWEEAVARCLRTYAHLTTGHPAPDDLAQTLTATRLACQRADGQATMFQLRLGLTAAGLAAELDPGTASSFITEVIDAAEQSADAYAAREVLGHPACQAHMTPAQTTAFITRTDQAGLDRGTIPPPLLADLTQSVSTAAATLTQALSSAR